MYFDTKKKICCIHLLGLRDINSCEPIMEERPWLVRNQPERSTIEELAAVILRQIFSQSISLAYLMDVPAFLGKHSQIIALKGIVSFFPL